MTGSTLKQVLTAFEQADGPLSLGAVARELNVSQERLESMIEYWVRKGRIQEISTAGECRTCGIKGQCPFVMQMPRSYELTPTAEVIPLHDAGLPCRGNGSGS